MAVTLTDFGFNNVPNRGIGVFTGTVANVQNDDSWNSHVQDLVSSGNGAGNIVSLTSNANHRHSRVLKIYWTKSDSTALMTISHSDLNSYFDADSVSTAFQTGNAYIELEHRLSDGTTFAGRAGAIALQFSRQQNDETTNGFVVAVAGGGYYYGVGTSAITMSIAPNTEYMSFGGGNRINPYYVATDTESVYAAGGQYSRIELTWGNPKLSIKFWDRSDEEEQESESPDFGEGHFFNYGHFPVRSFSKDKYWRSSFGGR